jgi:hypothetical protein
VDLLVEPVLGVVFLPTLVLLGDGFLVLRDPTGDERRQGPIFPVLSLGPLLSPEQDRNLVLRPHEARHLCVCVSEYT